MGQEHPQLFTTQQAAEMLGLSDSRVRWLIMHGEAHPHSQIGGTNMFSREEVERLQSRPWLKRKEKE